MNVFFFMFYEIKKGKSKNFPISAASMSRQTIAAYLRIYLKKPTEKKKLVQQSVKYYVFTFRYNWYQSLLVLVLIFTRTGIDLY